MELGTRSEWGSRRAPCLLPRPVPDTPCRHGGGAGPQGRGLCAQQGLQGLSDEVRAAGAGWARLCPATVRPAPVPRAGAVVGRLTGPSTSPSVSLRARTLALTSGSCHSTAVRGGGCSAARWRPPKRGSGPGASRVGGAGEGRAGGARAVAAVGAARLGQGGGVPTAAEKPLPAVPASRHQRSRAGVAAIPSACGPESLLSTGQSQFATGLLVYISLRSTVRVVSLTRGNRSACSLFACVNLL